MNFITLGKIATLGLWGVLIVNLFVPLGGEYSVYLTWGLLGLVLTHQFESLLFVTSDKNSDRPLLADGMQVFVFGFFHGLAVKNQQAEA